MAEYIDREALIDAIEGINWYKYNDEGRLTQGGTSHDKMFLPYTAVEGTIKSAPAADVRPTVKAHFNLVDGYSITALGYDIKGLECSSCGATFIAQTWVKKFKFCPNCGADMREES